ncbi:MAG: aminodeoxychorismate synthase component I [Vicinamibacterales bacterium]
MIVHPFEAVLRTPFGGPWRRFASPLRVVRSSSTGDVASALGEVDEAVRSGLYAAGFVTYEAASAFGLAGKSPASELPLVCFGLFSPDNVETLARFPVGGEAAVGAWTPSVDHDTYRAAVATIKGRIEAGDTYQINYTLRMTAPFVGDPRALMRDLHARQAGPWSAFIDIGSHAICSASPELFFVREDDTIECRPMKGTAPRGWWAEQDVARAAALNASEKNRAENVMIVDMIRNDLGRVARTGSVRVRSLFDAERYPLQWQLTSRVVANVADATLVSLFEAMFPSGSVTGAPKTSAMAIISELESSPRGVYTGAIGYLSPHGRSHFSVAIRTAVIDRQREIAEFGVGSGIVWDSVDRDEYDECLIKAAMLTGSSAISGFVERRVPAYVTAGHPTFRLLETLGWTPASGYALLDRHITRIEESAQCFGFSCDLGALRLLLDDAAAGLTRPSKVRLLLDADGGVLCEALDLAPFPQRPLRAAFALEPNPALDVFLFHKTTRRDVYDRARAGRPQAEAVILWNAASEITEATDFNVVAEIDGAQVTPPLDCGLLPGTMRAELLASGEIIERRVSVEQLASARRKWLINSVRGWLEFTI